MIDLTATSWARGAETMARSTKRRGAEFSAFADIPVVNPNEAIDFLSKRTPLPLARLEEILDEVSGKAREITGELYETIANRIDAKIVQAVEQGETLDDFLGTLDEVTATLGLTKADPYYWETVFRNNVQSSYGAGRWEMFNHPDVVDFFPYFQYFTVGDSAVREEHAALHGHLFRREDPDAENLWPPNGHGCRCNVVAVSEDEIEDEGLTIPDALPKVDGKTVAPAEGWGGTPQTQLEMAV